MGASAWAWAAAFTLVTTIPLLLHAHDLSQTAHADRIASGDDWTAFSTALLTGGPRRAIDTVIVGLVERKVLAARAGVISKAAPAGTLSPLERAVLDSVGRGTRLSSLRLAAVLQDNRPFAVIYKTFQERSLVAIGGWRRYAQIFLWTALLSAPPVAVLFGMDRAALDGWAPALGVLGLVTIPATLLTARHGRWGPDPRTALGHAVSRRLRERPTVSRADVVAAGGLAAIEDRLVRNAIQDVEPDGVWGPSAPGTARDLTELNWLGEELIHNRL